MNQEKQPQLVEFDWHGESWSIRPTYEQQPYSGEYLIQKHNAPTSIPMNLNCLTLHLGIHKPEPEIPLETVSLFFHLTSKITPEPLPYILQTANELRIHNQ